MKRARRVLNRTLTGRVAYAGARGDETAWRPTDRCSDLRPLAALAWAWDDAAGKVFRFDRAAEQETLRLSDTSPARERKLFLGLDAGCDHPQAELPTQRCQRGDDGAVAFGNRSAAHEFAVDLDAVDQRPTQRREAGRARAELVEHDTHAGFG